ncbi:Conidial yellow pigment biosynthesis polyketide synthase [Talaromyces islandicus]|uniref:Conidial yellow pigment biosynthesis polyketide synthase n=1 Tax=Talaromyces islandicus TaxID=28573 RepID=A0A0U1M8Y6_TALIS|nr:Conidial yellow pigment biosynthesis polyketide synthase [Talaromyces islandicus]
MAQLLLCGPQRLPSQQPLRALRELLLRQTSRAAALSSATRALPALLRLLAAFDASLDRVSSSSLDFLLQWLESGTLSQPVETLPSVVALPFAVLLQSALFLKHLDREDDDGYKHTLQSLQRHGVQGFCTGFLTAAAIAFSEGEESLAKHVVTSVRLAACIGAYIDQNATNPACSLSVRWRDAEFSIPQVEALLAGYPDAYIACITDSTCVTVTAHASDEQSLTEACREAGLRVKAISINGRFHAAAVHADAADNLKAFTNSVKGLQYPPATQLHAPLRRNDTGDLITGDVAVSDVAIDCILLHTADWYTTVRKTLGPFPTAYPAVTTLAFEKGVLPLSLSQSHDATDDVKELNRVNGVKGTNAINGVNGIKINGINPVNGVNGVDGVESKYPPHSVAVVGMACRFPGAADVNAFWNLLESGVSMVREVPSDRFNLKNHRLAGYGDAKFWGNFIDDPESFDHRFFKKSSREAVSWDPEKRILLEVVYEALESAGHFGPAGKDLPNDYGCYIGAVGNNYYDNVSCHPPNAYSMLGTSRGFFSGRISHQFGFTGPAMTIDTACSSSLVAINTACRAIQSGECSRAIAGGVNIFTSPFDYQNLAAAGFLSPSGACKPFDASADGYCRGEGVAAVVLKPLSTAIEEGDNVLGVIVGSAVNQNHNDAHITVPCSSSQTTAYNKVLGMANAPSSSVTYVEAHGTGTQVGDPIECQSIRDAFGGAHRKEILHFGSVKGNIGHTEASAGVAGLIKTLLMMQHNTILGQASYNNLNPKIPALEPDMMAIPKRSQPWNASPKLACVNSYGAAGSNAVVAIREAITASTMKRPTITAKQPLLMSASSDASLKSYATKLLAYVEIQRASFANATHLLSDILFNLTDRTNHKLTYSVAKAVTDLNDFEKTLKNIVAGSETVLKDVSSSSRPVIMAVGGQESDFIGLSEEVVDNSPLLKSHLDECDSGLQSLGYGSIYPAIFQRHTIQDLPALHAVLFAVQYASAKAWIDSGMRVDSIVGHSFGQLTALCISGCLSLNDTMRLVVERAELIVSSWGQERGSMISVQSDRTVVNSILDVVNAELPDKLEIACFNHSKNHVLVGTANAVSALESHISSDDRWRNVRAKRLRVTHGFHSALTEQILLELEKVANSLQWNKPTIPIELATETHIDKDPGPWLIPHHMRNPVYFSSAIQRVAKKFQSCVWVETGQGSSIMSLIKNCLNGQGQQLYCPSFLNGPNAVSSVAETVVELWKAGIHVQFWPYHRSARGNFEYKSLPPYQFEKTKHWLPFVDKATSEPAAEVAPTAQVTPTHEFISFMRFSDPSEKEAIFLVDPESERYMYLLNGHIASNQALAPASLYVELLSRATMLLTKGASYDTHVLNMNSMQMQGAPIGLDSKKNIYIKLTRITPGVDKWDFEFSSKLKQGSDDVQIHVIGKTGLGRRDDPVLAETIHQWSALIGFKKCLSIMACEDGEKMQGRHIYQALQRLIFFDEMYHGIKSISCQGHEAAGKVAAELDPKLPPSEALYDTPTIDGMMQFAGVLVNYFAHPSGKDILLCQGINRVVTGGAFDITAKEWIAYSLLTEDNDERTVSDVYIFDKKSQQVVIAFIGFVFTRTSVSVLQRSLRSVNTGGAGANPTPAPAGAAKAPLPVPVAKTPGQSSKTSQVLEVLHNVTDVPFDEIAPTSTLEDLGIDSLLVTEVLNEIQTAFGLEIDLNTFLFFPNVKAVCDHIDAALGVDTSAAVGPVPGAKVNSTAVQSIQTAPPDTELRPSLHQTQKVFADCRDAYTKAAVETQAVGFWEKCYPRQASLVLAHVVHAFAKLGCDMAALKAGDTAPMIPHLPRHKQLVRQLYRVLEDAKLVVNDEGEFIRTEQPVDPTPASTIYEQIIPQFPLHASVHKLVQVVGLELAECLTGEKDGLQIVFGNKENKKTLDDLYEKWPLVRSGTLALGEFLQKSMESSDKLGVFRILEVGAGTGGTTKYIVHHLQKLGIPFEYVFTDLSPSLVAAAKRTFKDCPEMEFTTLDIEKEPRASWVRSFHFIISTNCVHATRNLTVSLTSLRKMLRDDGVLTLVEITQNMFWLDIAVGLFEGWWLFEDGRAHAVTPEGLWKEHMLRAGFEAVDWTDGEDPEARTIRVIAGFPTGLSA